MLAHQKVGLLMWLAYSFLSPATAGAGAERRWDWERFEREGRALYKAYAKGPQTNNDKELLAEALKQQFGFSGSISLQTIRDRLAKRALWIHTLAREEGALHV